MLCKIRKIVIQLEETQMENGRVVSPSTRRALAMAVIENPYAGRYFEDLSGLIEIGEKLGALLAERAIAVLGIPGDQIQSFGKAAIVGEAGELEHAATLPAATRWRKPAGAGPAACGRDRRRLRRARRWR